MTAGSRGRGDSRKVQKRKDLPSAFNGVMVAVEVGASARNTGQSKPHSKKFAPYKKTFCSVLQRNVSHG